MFQRFMEEWVTGKFDVPEVESWQTFRTNVKRGLNTILDQTNRGNKIGVFTSGGTIAAVVAESLQIKDEERVAALNFSIRNTSYSRFFYSNDQFNLLAFNELPHLTKEMITFV